MIDLPDVILAELIIAQAVNIFSAHLHEVCGKPFGELRRHEQGVPVFRPDLSQIFVLVWDGSAVIILTTK
jgi:hypothetical protein